MSVGPFGHFTLIDSHGGESGDVIIASEAILLQRGRRTDIHDLSYLVVWSGKRIAAMNRELDLLASRPEKIVDASTPELRHVLHAIAPTATAVFRRAGRCRRLFTRRALRAILQTPAGAAAAPALGHS
jgi:hypothetical protein